MNSIKDNKKETNIQVVVRIRPPTEKEIIEGYPISITPKDSNQVVAITPHATTTRTFSFDKVFSQHDTQSTIYNEIVSPMIKEVLEGYNCTIFAYGQTGTGKTYTMEGDLTKITKDDIIIGKDCGMIPRALDEFFNYLNKDGIEYSLRVSCIEIYNEQLKDLLTSDTSLKLQFYENSFKKVTVKNLEEIPVKNVYDAIQLFQKGMNERKTASTNYNERSSRSHCVYSITVHITENTQDQDLIKIGKLNLVDLAGSESIGRSGAENKQAREAGMINQSLLALGRVINSLVEKAQHIPYRESKLTRLLQDSLGGKTKTCIIATVAPTRYSIEESLSTLDYAFRAKNIRNKPEVNQHMTKKALIQDYMNEIKQLKNMLRCAREKDGVYLSNEDYNQMKFSSSVNVEENKRLKKLIDDQENEILGLKHSLKDKSDKIQDLKDTIDENIKTIIQKDLDISNIQQKLTEEGVLLKSHMLTEDNLNNILNDLNKILKNCSIELYKFHLFADNKLSLESDNRIIFTDFRDRTIKLMNDLIIRLNNIKSQNNDYDQYIFNSIQLFINEKIKNLKDISVEVDKRMQDKKVIVTKFNQLSLDNILYNDNLYKLIKEEKSIYMKEYHKLFDDNMKAIENEFESFNNSYDYKQNMINEYNDLVDKEVKDLTKDLSSFTNSMMNQIINVKDDIIKQKNKEIEDLKKTIEFVHDRRNMELKKIKEDKTELLNNIKDLIESFTDTHSKMFTETIEPVTESLNIMSNDMGSEIEQFNRQFTNIETDINNNDNILNNYITSLNAKIENHKKDNLNFINESKIKYNVFDSLLKSNMTQMDSKFNDFNESNNKLLNDLECKSKDYKENVDEFNNSMMTELEKDRLFINNNYMDNIKSSDIYLESINKNNNENERIKSDNYNNYQNVSNQLKDELEKSNTIFKENPLLNKCPEKNKYFNIYSWKTTPNHDNILNKYRELYQNKVKNINNINNNNHNNYDNDVIVNNDIENEKESENTNIAILNIDENENENKNKNKNKNENENESESENKNENESENENENENESENNNEDDIQNDNNNKKEEESMNEIKKQDKNNNDFTVNDISIKEVLYLSHDNINYDYKEMRLEELENKNNLFNYDLIKSHNIDSNNLSNLNINNTINNNEDSVVGKENSTISLNNEDGKDTFSLLKNEDNSQEEIEKDNESFLENNLSVAENNLINEFKSTDDEDFSEGNKKVFPLNDNDNNNNDHNDNYDDDNEDSNSLGTVEILINDEKNENSNSDSSDSSVEIKIKKKSKNSWGTRLRLKNEQKTKSIQKMDSAIELEEKLNNKDHEDDNGVLDVSLSSIKKNIAMNINNYNNNNNNNNNNNVAHNSLVTRKTFKNQKPLAGFNFTEKKILIRSSSVPNTPAVVNKNHKSPKSKDDLSLRNMQGIKLIKPVIEPF